MLDCTLSLYVQVNEEESIIAQSRNTFAKRAREMDKKRKANEKRASKRERKLEPSSDKPPEMNEPNENDREHIVPE